MIFKKLIKKCICSITTLKKNSSVNDKATISYFVRFYNSSIGKYSYISNNCNVFHTVIGNYVSIGLGCNIGGGEHPLNWVSTSPAFQNNRTMLYGLYENKYNPFKETVIGNDVWIGPNSIIKSGVTISDGAVVGAGSIVTKNIGPFEIWGGNPAHFIRKRFDDNICNKLIETHWWNWDDKTIVKYGNAFTDVNAFLKQYYNDKEIDSNE